MNNSTSSEDLNSQGVNKIKGNESSSVLGGGKTSEFIQIKNNNEALSTNKKEKDVVEVVCPWCGTGGQSGACEKCGGPLGEVMEAKNNKEDEVLPDIEESIPEKASSAVLDRAKSKADGLIDAKEDLREEKRHLAKGVLMSTLSFASVAAAAAIFKDSSVVQHVGIGGGLTGLIGLWITYSTSERVDYLKERVKEIEHEIKI